MPKKVDKAICNLLREAIKYEREAPPMYRTLLEKMINRGVIDNSEKSTLSRIIIDEKWHEKSISEIAESKSCDISLARSKGKGIYKEEKRKEYYELPLSERIRMARELIVSTKWDRL